MTISLALILLLLSITVVFIFIYFFFRRALLFFQIKRAQKKYGESILSYKKLAIKGAFTSLLVLAMSCFIILIPNVVAYDKLSGLSQECPVYEDDRYNGSTLHIITIIKETSLMKFNPYNEEHSPSDVHHYEFEIVENLENNTLSSREITYSTLVSNLGFQVGIDCFETRIDINEGSTYLVFLRYRSVLTSFTSTDPRMRDGDNYTIPYIVELINYNTDISYTEQSTEILEILNDFEQFIVN